MNTGRYANTHNNQTSQLTTETHQTVTLEHSTGEVVQHSISTVTVETVTRRTPIQNEVAGLLALLNGLIER